MFAEPRRQRGMSLVELMVGMVIALLVSLAAANSARVFAASQRAGMAAGGVGVNVATTLGAIKTDVSSAGLGFFSDSNFMCHQLAFSNGAAVRYNNAGFSPVSVTRVGSNDELEVMYGSEVDGGATLFLDGNSNGSSASLRSMMPAVVGQAALLIPDPLTKLGQPCLIRSITANTPPTETSRQQLAFASTGAFNQASFSTSPSFTDGDRVGLLGNLRWLRYRMEGSNLMVDERIGGQSGVLARNVMSFRVQYGVTADATSSTLTGWQDATGSPWAALAGSPVERVRALRLGIVVRSAHKEKPSTAGGECDASTALPRDPLDPSVELALAGSDWKCYRYRSAVAVVPLRNMIW